jgi:hypothetical protein
MTEPTPEGALQSQAPKPVDPTKRDEEHTEHQIERVQLELSGFERSTLRWTKASFGIVAATGLFICLQWFEMRSSGVDTHDLAVAAKTANENALHADRPWVGVVLQVDSFGLDKTPTATVGFFNSGRRPAKVTLTQYRWAPYTVLPMNPPYPDSGTMKSTDIVLPNAQSTVTFTIDGITEAEMSAFKARSVTFYIYANVEYDDPVTNEHYWSHACWRYMYFEGGIRSGFYNCEGYNEAK